MSKIHRFHLNVGISLLILCLSGLVAHATPTHLIFTYSDNSSTSLTANWQVIDGSSEVSNHAEIRYDLVSRKGQLDQYEQHAVAGISRIDGLADRTICRVVIDDLIPGTTYYLIVGSPETGYSEEVKVRTIPDDDSALRFVTGGDMGISEDTRTLLRHAASYDPQFAVVGGDIAYGNGQLSNVSAWDTWLEYYTEEMVTSDGLQIPLVVAIGNHEVRGSYNQSKDKAPFYFGFFGQDPEKSYFTRSFGANFVLLVLDSGHIATHASQADWLREQLEAHQSVTHRAAVYHVPLYPSHRDLMDTYARAGRKHWGPLFDEYAITVCFENHDHSYKRSHLLKGGKPTTDGTGTLYLGDGCWGRGARGVDFMPRDYLAQSGSVQHFWLVDISPDAMQYKAIDLDNRVFDVYPADSLEANAAEAVFAEKKQTYFIPSEAVEITDMECGTPIWHGGQSIVTIRNVFDFPVSADLTSYFPSNVRINNTVKIKGLAIQPGETVSIPLDLTTTADKGYETTQVNFYLRVHLRAIDAELTFETTYGIRASVAEIK